MLGLTVHAAKTTPSIPRARAVIADSIGRPSVRHRPATVMPMPWPRTASATHYFDASSQSALTLRTVMDVRQPRGESLLVDAVNTLVSATCPQSGMDSESHAYFSLLLNMHLAGLEPEELKRLAKSLKSAGYDSVSDSAAQQADRYDESGLVSDRPQDRASLPADWHQLIDEAIDHSAAIARRPLAGKPPGSTEARAARQCLLDAALQWPVSGQSMTDIVVIAQRLSDALGLSLAPQVGCSGKLLQRGSVFDWTDDTLVIDKSAFRALAEDSSGKCFPDVLRDLLELLLTRKMFGEAAHPSRLCAPDRTRLNRAMQAVLQADPVAPGVVLQQAAARLLANAGTLGKVQVLPTVGVALGHAAMGPALSVAPDLSKPPLGIGTRYLHPGFRLEPDDCEVRQWPTRWLDANEHATLLPESRAWQVTVPVERGRLEEAARHVADLWKQEARPYRFIGTAPGMPATDSRASVLQAIEHGMDDEARALFAYFNAGLPEPESTTELAVRMNGFMRWLSAAAAGSHH